MTTTTPRASARTYGGHSESERVIERRERFLEAGFEIFGTKGYRGATVRGICRAARLTERYFYESFDGMDALFCAVFERQLLILGERFMTVIPHMTREVRGRVEAVCALYFSLMRDPRLVRILYVEPLASSERAVAVYNTNILNTATIAGIILRADHPDLDLEEDIARTIGLALSGVCSTLAVQWMLDNYRLPDSKMIESASTVMLGTLDALRQRPTLSPQTDDRRKSQTPVTKEI